MVVSEKLRAKGVVIAKGESITHDGKIIATAKRDCYKGETIAVSAFRWLGVPKPSFADKIAQTPGIREYTDSSGKVELHIEIDGETRVIGAY